MGTTLPVPGEGQRSQTLKRLGGHKKWQTKNQPQPFGSALSRQRFGRTMLQARRATALPSPGSIAMRRGSGRRRQSFGRNDLLVLAKVADQAHSRIVDLERTEDEAEQTV